MGKKAYNLLLCYVLPKQDNLMVHLIASISNNDRLSFNFSNSYSTIESSNISTNINNMSIISTSVIIITPIRSSNSSNCSNSNRCNSNSNSSTINNVKKISL